MKTRYKQYRHARFILVFLLGVVSKPVFSVSSTLYVSDFTNQALYTVSTVNASASLVGSFIYDAGILSLAYDSSNNILYGSGRYGYESGNITAGQLFTINLQTGAATIVGPHGPSGYTFGMSGLAYDHISDSLFGTYGMGGEEALYAIDPSTGTATLIGSLGGYQIHGLTFDPVTNLLYGSAYTEPPGQAAFLTIDKTTGETTLVNLTTQSLAGLAFDPNTGALYGIDDGGISGTYSTGLYEVNKYTGETSLIGITPLASPHGLEFVTSIPIPPAIWLFGTGLVGLVAMARRKKAM